MPGLKGERKGLDNIKSMMAKREKSALNEIPEILNFTVADLPEAAPAQMYSDVFLKVGSTTRAKYESGNPPLLHRTYFEALVKNMNGQRKANVILEPILQELRMSRGVSISILSCLEHYGYLQIERIPNVRGKRLMFEVLHGMG